MNRLNNTKKAIVIMMVFSFVVLPLSQVLADNSVAPASSQTTSSSTSVVPNQSVGSQSTPAVSSPATTSSTSTSAQTDTTTTPATTPTDTTLSATPSDSSTTTPTSTDPTLSGTPATNSGNIKNATPGLSTPTAQSSAQISNNLTPTQINSASSKQLIPQTDPSTGALVYSYPITTPPGRNGIEPGLSLQYSSQNPAQDSAFGYGWSTNIPYISRVNKTGTDQLYTSNYFTSSLSGDLVLVSGSTYGPRVETGDFLKYSLSGNTWTVTDKKGTVYTFGSQAATRQDNPSNSAQIFKWLLEKVQDTNGNFISYTYFKDSGQIYPSSIVYTSNASNTGIFEVDFLRQSRADSTISYAPTFLVTTNYRINEIDVKTSGAITHKYVLAYTTGDNFTRSILNTITESGTDETTLAITTLPPVTFTHNKNSSTAWSNSNWNWPTGVTPDFTTGSTIVADVNGDGLPDIMQSYKDSNGANHQSTYLNNADGTWTLSAAYTPPIIFTSYQGGPIQNNGVTAIDINGDGLTDLINGADNTIWLNTGTGWAHGTSSYYYAVPLGIDSYATGATGTRIADLNGDGLPDLLELDNGGSGVVVPHVYLNNGTGFGTDVGSNWTFPSGLASWNTTMTYTDLNGDGIADIVYILINPSTGAVTQAAYLGNGAGQFISSTAYTPNLNLSFFGANVISDPGVRFADVNGDGLPDLVLSVGWGGTTHNQTLLNTGSGWQISTAWNSPVPFSDGTFVSAAFGDLNGDGTSDIYTGSNIYLNNGTKTDLLSTINYSQGGSATINYAPTTSYKSGSTRLNPTLPIVLETVFAITLNDNNGGTMPTNYSYSGGLYYYNQASPLDRKFAGFNIITKTDGAQNTTKTFFHQGNGTDSAHGEYNDNFWKIGKVYRVEVANSSGTLYSKTVNRWDDSDLGSTNHFVKLAQTVNYAYDGLSTHKDKAESYTYDNTTGNLTSKIEYGQVTGNDDGTFTGSAQFTTNYVYAAGGNVVGLPSDITTVDQSSSKVKEDRFYFDGLTLGGATKGNQTKHEIWKSGSAYINTQKTYDGTFGLVATDIDANGNTTTYVYDLNNLYPATVTNALNQATQFVYDYSSGQVKQKTDPNSRVFVNKYDGLDRPLEIDQPDLTTPTTLVPKTTYVYTDTSGAVSVSETDYLSSGSTVTKYIYYDGLNREIQDRKTESNSNYQVKDLSYNPLGLLQKESLPYFSTGSSKTSPTSTTSLYINYTYDPLQRITTTVNAVGTTTNTYANWKLTTTDANGKNKDLTSDAYGNLVEVDEHNSGSTYTTTYTYDYLGDLLNITDALGNVRNFTYNGLGQRLTSQDLHATGDSTFGTYSYGYDNNGNLTQKIDPNSNTVNYTYDVLNRELTEKLGLTAKVTNVYDGGTNGIGHLTSVQTPSYTQTLLYNPLGGLKSETKTINSTDYTTAYTYDRQGNQLTITNPDNSQVQYTYDAGGLVSSVQRKESTDSGFTNVVSSFTYVPTEQVAVTNYTNGSVTTNTYDPTKLYRLSSKVTIISGGSHAQDLSYTYDPVGNITQIIDASNTDTKKTITYGYDDLNRLNSASATNVASGQTAYSTSYTYNAIGDLLTKSDASGTYAYAGNTGSSYANPDAPTSIGSETLTYDNNGNELTNGAGLTNTWDYNNQLTKVVASLNTDTYTYDATGQRITSTSASNGTQGQAKINLNSPAKLGSGLTSGGTANASSPATTVSVLVVGAGAGGGAGSNGGGGGGAGGLLFDSAHPITPQAYSITVGLGGTAATLNNPGGNGGYSLFDTMGAIGGGGGGGGSQFGDGKNGGSGGGGAQLGGIKGQSVTGQGNYGGTGAASPSAGGGGGGAAAVGGNSTGNNNGGTGGNGISNSISGSAVTYAGGGGGSAASIVPSGGAGGIGGGGTGGGNWSGNPPTQGTDNLGGGGGGGGAAPGNTGAKGGSGIVIISYPTGSITATGGNITTVGGNTIHTFISNGTFTVVSVNAAPTVTTQAVTSIGSSTAIGNGNVTSDGGSAVTERGVVLSTVVNPTTSDTKFTSPGTTGVFTASMTGLSSGTLYHVRAYATNFIGTSYGSDVTFTTTVPNTAPTVTTQAASSITSSSAVCNGTVTSDGGNAITERGIVWSMSANPTTSNGKVTTTGTTGVFSATVSGLAGSTLYHARAYAINSIGTSYGADVTFTTTASVSGSGITTIYPSKFFNTDGTNIVKHIFANGVEVATITGTGSTATPRYVATDSLTGSNVTTDSTDAKVELLDYFPFGSTRFDEKAGSYGDQRQFASMEISADNLLSYDNARYFNAAQGQFVSEDPLFINTGFTLSDPQSFNAYAYARNNPIVNIDPTGQWFEEALSWVNAHTGIGNAVDNSSSYNFLVSHPYVPVAVGNLPLVTYAAVQAGAVTAIAAAAQAATTWALANPQFVTNSTVGSVSGVLSKAVANSETGQKSNLASYFINGVAGGLSYSAGESANPARYNAALSFGSSVASDISDKRPIDWTGALLSSGVSSGTAAITQQVSGVPGPQAQSFSTAITSARTQQAISLESFSFSAGVFANTVRNTISSSISGFAKSAWNAIGGK